MNRLYDFRYERLTAEERAIVDARVEEVRNRAIRGAYRRRQTYDKASVERQAEFVRRCHRVCRSFSEAETQVAVAREKRITQARANQLYRRGREMLDRCLKAAGWRPLTQEERVAYWDWKDSQCPR